jgi:hypothetical protein
MRGDSGALTKPEKQRLMRSESDMGTLRPPGARLSDNRRAYGEK